MKKIVLFLKNIILAPFIIYLYNLVASPLNFVIPINICTILIVGILGIPGLISLLILFVVAF